MLLLLQGMVLMFYQGRLDQGGPVPVSVPDCGQRGGTQQNWLCWNKILRDKEKKRGVEIER